ncbi:MAG: CoA transferase [Coriobacteriaceae bacterium]|jgi:L-carnitine CoA-transferase|nr:CoA transferase [Coriobacteriaceae bacterium]
MKRNEIPDFGPLQGVNVVHLTNSLAGPYCALRLAEFGAKVTWIENPKVIDLARTSRWSAEAERRNQRSICLDAVSSPEGREVLTRLLAGADIMVDSFPGGKMAEWGFSDERLWEINPRLVIVHISGYGQTGLPEFVKRPAYDPVMQGFGCYSFQNGEPTGKPSPATPGVCDYITGLTGAYGALAALTRARETGVGESVDVSQFESLIAMQGQYLTSYIHGGSKMPRRGGSHHYAGAGYGTYTCKDGKDLYWIMLGVKVVRQACEFLGITDQVTLTERSAIIPLGTPDGDVVEKALTEKAASMTAEEFEQASLAAGVPCGQIYDYDDALADPHYAAREVFIEWNNDAGDTIKGINIFPRFTKNPNKVWRGLMPIGGDAPDILEELGYTPEEAKALFEAKVVKPVE